MSSRAFRVTLDNVPHLINLNHVNKVALIEDTLKIYFNTNKNIVGMSVIGTGILSGNSLYSAKVKYADKAEAKNAFEEIAKLM
jgi:hypothetical protein